jgi:hypothetical protein
MGGLLKPYFFDCQQAVISKRLLTQTLTTIPQCGIVGFFASHLFTKASF